MSQPEPGTERYQRQVETICKQAEAAGIGVKDLDCFLLLFVLDESYSRAASCDLRGREEAQEDSGMSDETVSGMAGLGNPFGGNVFSEGVRDIFKDGASPALEAQWSLVALREAIYPPSCEECGHEEQMLLGDVEKCLLEAQDAIQQVEPGHRHQWVQKLFLLLWDSREEFHPDWVEGLKSCPKKGWAGEMLGYIHREQIIDAWCTLLKALRGEADDSD